MKRFPTLTIILAITLIISACGAEPVPTTNPADVQNTAVAAALTIVAQTQAAIPTATLPPPTEMPTQTLTPVVNTPIQGPTQVQATSTTAPAANSGGDPCATRVLSGEIRGRETKIRIWNTTKVAVTVSIYLNETAAHGSCGYRSYKLGKNDDVVITDLVQGCYNLWAWSDDPKGRFRSEGYGCINNSDKWTFQVNDAAIKFTGP